ncbi:hypothetical protein CRENBAI_019469 [Crenichthys baileyi]|uniref:Uncharacterized protein n=1 Tax=Crenichthys baileyi TaxID=28760 RepID=A0AAV9RQW6_9TELE
MLPASLPSEVLHCTESNRMFQPKTDPADEQKADTLDRWVQRQMEEAMRHLPKDLEVLPSPLLLDQMEPKPSSSSRSKNRRRAGVPSRSAGEEESPTAAVVTSGAVVSQPADVKAVAINPSSSSATALSARVAAPLPKPSSHSPAQDSEATPEELEERLRFFARQIKSFRKTCLLYSSSEFRERIKQMEEDYETAVRQFYCRPPSPTPSHRSAAAVQPTLGLQRAAAEKSRSCLQNGAVAVQPTSCLQSAAAAEQPTPGLQSASAAAAVEQSTQCQQPAAEFPGGSEDGPPPFPVPEGPEDGPPLFPVSEGSEGPLTVFQAELTHSLTYSPSLPQPPPHVAEDAVRGTPWLKSSGVLATPRPLRTPLRVSATPRLLRTPLRVSGTPRPLCKPLRVLATPLPLLTSLSLGCHPRRRGGRSPLILTETVPGEPWEPEKPPGKPSEALSAPDEPSEAETPLVKPSEAQSEPAAAGPPAAGPGTGSCSSSSLNCSGTGSAGPLVTGAEASAGPPVTGAEASSGPPVTGAEVSAGPPMT